MNRHDLDSVSLMAGLVFAALGLSFLLGGTAFLDLDWRWVWPPVLIGAGAVGLRGARRENRQPDTDPAA